MDKTERVLSIYFKLLNGHILYKSQAAQEYGVNERTIHRDIEAIRQYLANQTVNTGCIKTLNYDRTVDGYRFREFYWKVELLLKSEWKAYYNDS